MMNSKLDSKMIIIDVDFNRINTDHADNFNKMQNVLNKISGYQNLILVTNENLKDCVNYLNDLGLRTGYLVSNSGSVIYNIGASKTLFEKKISFLDAQSIAHIATMKDLLLIINDRNGDKISYKINEWNNKIISNQLLGTKKESVKICETYPEFINHLETMNINSIEIFLPSNKNEVRDKKINDFFLEITRVVEVDLFWLDKQLFVTPKNATRLHALVKISKQLNLDLGTSGLYVGAVSFYNKLVNYCYFCATSRAVFNNCKDLLTGKLPTIFYDNGINSWINWLDSYDYLWSYQPNSQLYEKLNNYYDQLSSEQLAMLSEDETKLIQIVKDSKELLVLPSNNNLSKKHKLSRIFTRIKQLPNTINEDEIDENIETILIWKDDKDQWIKQVSDKLSNKVNE